MDLEEVEIFLNLKSAKIEMHEPNYFFKILIPFYIAETG